MTRSSSLSSSTSGHWIMKTTERPASSEPFCRTTSPCRSTGRLLTEAIRGAAPLPGRSRQPSPDQPPEPAHGPPEDHPSQRDLSRADLGLSRHAGPKLRGGLNQLRADHEHALPLLQPCRHPDPLDLASEGAVWESVELHLHRLAGGDTPRLPLRDGDFDILPSGV